MILLGRTVWSACLSIALLWASVAAAQPEPPVPPAAGRSPAKALALAGGNRAEMEKALSRVPPEQARGMAFLMENMPERDLKALSASFLLEHVDIAYRTRARAKWGDRVPETIFFAEVLPYAAVNEARDNVRKELHERFWPVVRELDSISLAAARLNAEVFRQLNVRYSTQRRRPDQGPRETMESGKASCTGLSILLIGACRACGIPARFVGVPLWTDRSGNHSWVEIWDDGWHFTGAAEPAGDDLDKAWFTGRAAKARPGDPRHGIFAVSFRRTDLLFPTPWAPGNRDVFGVDVTQRYAKRREAAPGTIEVRFRALDSPEGARRRVAIVVRNSDGRAVFEGRTNDDSSDANDHLTAALSRGKYTVEWAGAAGVVRQAVDAAEDGQLVTLIDPQVRPVAELAEFLQADPETRGDIAAKPFARMALSTAQCTSARTLLIQDRLRRVRTARQAEHERRCLVIGELKMPYAFTTFGKKPEAGWSLCISMHGGGGAPKQVNDRQWENQKRLYRLQEGIYLAPRAPTDTWNLWHQEHIDRFFIRLIENMIAFEDVNPDRVYLTGYSAGGDGVYQLAPRMADRFAAAAMMAGHPNETQPLGLRNLPFTLHVGAQDGAYNRNEVANRWKEQLAELRQQDAGGYEHWAKLHENKGHWMDRADAEGVRWMEQFSRNMIPDRVVWLQDDVLHSRFYWLAVSDAHAKPRQIVTASRRGNRITIEKADPEEVTVLLRDDMLDLEQPVSIHLGDEEVFRGFAKRTIANLANTLDDRGDPNAMFSARLTVATRVRSGSVSEDPPRQ